MSFKLFSLVIPCILLHGYLMLSFWLAPAPSGAGLVQNLSYNSEQVRRIPDKRE